MKTLLTTILLFIAVTGFGQTKSPLVWYKFESTNTYEDASGNGYTALPRGNVGYDPVYDAIYFDGNNDYIMIPQIDLGSHFAVSFWARTNVDVGVTPFYFFHMGGATTFWRTYLYNNQVRVGSTGADNAYYGTWTKNSLHHVVIEINSTLARIFVDGARASTQTDSAISATIPTNDSIYIGIGAGLTGDYRGYIDEVMIFKNLDITSSVLDSLYTKKYLLEPGATYFPITSKHIWLKKNGLYKIPSKDGLNKYCKQKYISSASSDTTVHILFADNFETWQLGEIPWDTVLYRWQAIMPNYYPSNQSIISVSGYGNVWRSQYLDQQGGPWYGFELSPMLDSAVTEIYVDVDCYWSPTWYDPPTYGYSGKAPWGGAFGGDFWLGDNYAYVDTVGDYNSTRGWGAHNGWGSGDPNHVRAYLYDQLRTTASGGYPYVYSVDPFVYTLTTVTRGEWHKYTTRIKLNTPGKQDGIFAQYKDGVMFMQDTTVMFRSLDQANHLLNKIDGLIIKYAFGGGPSYISEQTNVIYMDNIVAYYYPNSSPYYLAGPDDIGGTVTPMGGIIDETIYPDQILFNEIFTASTDTIKSHYSGTSYVPSSQNIITKTITGHTNPIRLVFLRWDDGLNGVEGVTAGATKSDSWVKIFTGTDTGGTPTYWYQEPGEHNGIPTVGNTLTINSTSCTIQYFSGKDWNKGWTIRYY